MVSSILLPSRVHTTLYRRSTTCIKYIPTATSGYTHCSGFSVRSHGAGKGAAGNHEAAFMAQSTLTPEELDGILKVLVIP